MEGRGEGTDMCIVGSTLYVTYRVGVLIAVYISEYDRGRIVIFKKVVERK